MVAKNLFAITDRSLTRTNWEINMNRLLAKLPRKIKNQNTFLPANIIDHPSKLIRALGGTDDFGLNRYDGVDIFITFYLKKHPLASRIDFGKRDNLKETLDLWEKNNGSEDD